MAGNNVHALHGHEPVARAAHKHVEACRAIQNSRAGFHSGHKHTRLRACTLCLQRGGDICGRHAKNDSSGQISAQQGMHSFVRKSMDRRRSSDKVSRPGVQDGNKERNMSSR